jgi:hypothetical protein
MHVVRLGMVVPNLSVIQTACPGPVWAVQVPRETYDTCFDHAACTAGFSPFFRPADQTPAEVFKQSRRRVDPQFRQAGRKPPGVARDQGQIRHASMDTDEQVRQGQLLATAPAAICCQGLAGQESRFPRNRAVRKEARVEQVFQGFDLPKSDGGRTARPTVALKAPCSRAVVRVR